MSSDGSTYFDSQLSRLPGNLVHAAREVASFAGHLVEPKEPKAFKWPEFLNKVNEYPGNDLTLNKFKDDSIHRQEATVSDMAKKVADILRGVISVTSAERDIVVLQENLENTFTSLDAAKASGWADFSKSSSGSESFWEYRFQFALPSQDLPDYLHLLVTTIKLEADIKDEASWRGLQGGSKKNFAAELRVMELLVNQSYKDPQ
ncbi:hypothetical protein AAF712_013963 [Marasmius tenuissimus]|uniref:Delta-endotoxin CytB n=1 Tax=Marasmius tenuissimus TaxID=585030 RepID=A0ABR2ZFQ2_9AGAR|nr:hypothetical protein PM082_001516 [Marasmius tenuissimus]